MSPKDRVKELCKKRNITVQKLEQSLSISNGTISKWDKSKPNSDNLIKVANFFNVSPEYIRSGYSCPYRKLVDMADEFGLNIPNEEMTEKEKIYMLYELASEDERRIIDAIFDTISKRLTDDANLIRKINTNQESGLHEI